MTYFAFWRPENTVLLVGVGHQPKPTGDPTQQEERERRAQAESILHVRVTIEVEAEPVAG